MGPLMKRIQRRRAQVAVTTIMRRAERDARIATTLFEDKARDGGLLIHQAIERAESRG